MLAKLANHIAKSADCKLGSYPPELAPVCNLASLPAADLDTVLQATEVGEVWDIGRLIAKQLRDESVVNVLQLIQIDPATIRRRWGVVLESGTYAIDGCALHVAQMFSSSRLRTKAALILSSPCVRGNESGPLPGQVKSSPLLKCERRRIMRICRCISNVWARAGRC